MKRHRIEAVVMRHVYETRRNVEAGLSAGEARRRALVQFGGIEAHKEGVRDERGTGWLDDGWSDIRFAARSLLRRPGAQAAIIGRFVAASSAANPIGCH